MTDTEKRDFCATLAEYWIKTPHERLGQLISNALFLDGKTQDVFYIRDDDILNAIEVYLRSG